MRKSEIEKLTRDERGRVAKRARRKIGSEVSLILSAGFACLMIILFVFGDRTFLPVAEALGVRPTVVWLALAAVLSVLWGTAHYFTGSRKIVEAREMDAAIRRAHQDKKNAETEAKVRAMNEMEGRRAEQKKK